MDGFERGGDIGRYLGHLGTHFIEVHYKDGSVAFLECWPDREEGKMQGIDWDSYFLWLYLIEHGVVREELLVP